MIHPRFEDFIFERYTIDTNCIITKIDTNTVITNATSIKLTLEKNDRISIPLRKLMAYTFIENYDGQEVYFNSNEKDPTKKFVLSNLSLTENSIPTRIDQVPVIKRKNDGEFVDEYPSMNHAADKNGIDRRTFRKRVKAGNTHNDGFFYHRKDVPFHPKNHQIRNAKANKVARIDPKTGKETIYNSQTYAAESIGCSVGTISSAVKTNVESCGFIWKDLGKHTIQITKQRKVLCKGACNDTDFTSCENSDDEEYTLPIPFEQEKYVYDHEPVEIINDIEWFDLIHQGKLEEKYLISKCGHVWSKHSKRCLKESLTDGYKRIRLCSQYAKIHRLMGESFLGLDFNDNLVVNHINGKKDDNRLDNLEITTFQGNCRHARDVLLSAKGNTQPVKQYTLEGEYIQTFASVEDAAKTLTTKIKAQTLSWHILKNGEYVRDGFIWKYKQLNNKVRPKGTFKVLEKFPKYEIYQDGTIWSNYHKGRILRPSISQEGYHLVTLYDLDGVPMGQMVHQLVAKAFIKNDDPKNKKQINHIDSNPRNNKIENLEWCTPSENVQHSFSHGKKNKNLKPVIQLDENGIVLNEFDSITNASKSVGVQSSSICAALKNGTKCVKCYWEYKNEN